MHTFSPERKYDTPHAIKRPLPIARQRLFAKGVKKRREVEKRVNRRLRHCAVHTYKIQGGFERVVTKIKTIYDNFMNKKAAPEIGAAFSLLN